MSVLAIVMFWIQSAVSGITYCTTDDEELIELCVLAVAFMFVVMIGLVITYVLLSMREIDNSKKYN